MIGHLTPTPEPSMLILLPLVAPLALTVPAAVEPMQDDGAQPAAATEVILGPEGHRYRWVQIGRAHV